MRALDTNVLARYLMADDPRQLLLAERVIQKCRQDAEVPPGRRTDILAGDSDL